MLFAFFLGFLDPLGFVQHVLATLAVIAEGGLFEHHHKVGQALVGDDLRNAGQREVAEEVFTVHTHRGGGETQLVGGLLQADEICAFQVRTHHIAQACDGDLLFVMEAHHCEAGSRTVGSVMLPDIGITHRCFL